MENIAYIHAASSYEALESIEIVPFRFDFNIFAQLNKKKLSSFTAMRLLSVALTLFFLSSLGQALALEKHGSKGSEVIAIQKCLQQLGYFKASTTGYYGSTTKSAVIKFQKDNRLTADGVVGNKTQKILQSKCSSKKPTTKQAGGLKLGSRSQAVKKLQQDLKQLNYFVGNPTGYFGPITKDTVIKFQRDKGLKADGIAGPTTLAAIQKSSQTSGIGGENFILRLGSKGSEVKSLQKRLKRLGYFKGQTTGYFGPYTRDVVIRFQKDRGVTADGIVGAKTQQAIDKTIKKSKQVKPKPKKTLTLPVGFCSNGNCDTLRLGDKGNYVRYLQTRLRHWGYFTSNPNGNYDSKTVEAVKRFQQDNELFPDGAVGPQTWQKIEKVNRCRKPILQRGDEGECVIKLQKRLREIGYPNVDLGGYFDYKTWEAVKQFQFRENLPDNGIVDSRTWEALEGPSKTNNRYVVLIPATGTGTLGEVRRLVSDAFYRNSGKDIQVGEFKDRDRAEKYSQSFRRQGFNARVVEEKRR